VGDHRSGARGSNDSSVVLVDRFGCRSRHAARGPSRPQVKSLRIQSVGLATRCESNSSWRKSAGSRVPAAKPGDRWRAPNQSSPRESGSSREHNVDGRRSGPEKLSSLTRWRSKRFWFLARGSGRSRVLAGRDRERQRHPLPTLLAVENTATVGMPPGSGVRSNSEMSPDCEQRS
jgi:hypothetical protein